MPDASPDASPKSTRLFFGEENEECRLMNGMTQPAFTKSIVIVMNGGRGVQCHVMGNINTFLLDLGVSR